MGGLVCVTCGIVATSCLYANDVYLMLCLLAGLVL